MDWSRAKTILIGAFLLLNVFLGYQLWLNEQSEVDFARRAQGGIDLLEEMLVQNRITINGDIPLETPVMNNLEVSLIDLSQLERPFSNQAITMNESAILSSFETPVSLPDTINRYQLDQLLEPFVWHIDEYRWEPLLSDEETIVFVQMNDKVPLFTAQIELHVKDSMLNGYRQVYFNVGNKGTGHRVIPSYTALRTLIENEIIKEGSTVHSIELGYYGHTYNADEQILAPVWRIIHDDHIHYVNGITGAIEKKNPIEKQEAIEKNNEE